MEFSPVLIGLAVSYALTEVFKQAFADVAKSTAPPWLTQLWAMVVGVAFTMLLASTEFARTIDVGGYNLASLSNYSLTLIGLGIGCGAIGSNHFKKAVDNNDVDKVTVPGARPTTVEHAGQTVNADWLGTLEKPIAAADTINPNEATLAARSTPKRGGYSSGTKSAKALKPPKKKATA